MMLIDHPLLTLLCVAGALLFDRAFAEPRFLHPLVGFGQLASGAEKMLNHGHWRRGRGLLAWLAVIVPLVLLGQILSHSWHDSFWRQWLVGSAILYFALGWQSLLQHAVAIARPLASHDIDAARQAVGMIVSRDTDKLNSGDVALAATESVLENGADGIFNAIFWFVVAGIPGVILFRLANTLDAMWGYKTPRYKHFGWAAARLDDLLCFIPARLTALSYALAGNREQGLNCWWQQGGHWKSPNAGPVMAAGAGALNIRLGGPAPYQNKLQDRPRLGPEQGQPASVDSIHDACHLINRSLVIWVAAIGLVAVVQLLIKMV